MHKSSVHPQTESCTFVCVCKCVYKRAIARGEAKEKVKFSERARSSRRDQAAEIALIFQVSANDIPGNEHSTPKQEF